MLTANQVTMWQALCLAGQSSSSVAALEWDRFSDHESEAWEGEKTGEKHRVCAGFEEGKEEVRARIIAGTTS